MKNKKSSKSKKLAVLPVFAMLLTGIVSITGVTYAWFSSGDRAIVSDINLNVKTADGILASWTGKDGTWKSALSLSENDGTDGAFKVVPSKSVAEVSTVNAVTDGIPNFYTARLGTDGDTLVTEAQPAARTAGADIDYVIFDIYFKVDRDTYLFLGENSKVESYDMIPATEEGGAETRRDTDTEKAARVGFIDQGNSLVNKDSSGTPVLPGLNGGSNMVIWEPHATEHISASGITTNTKEDYYGVSKLSAEGFKISEEIAKTDSEYLKKVNTYTEDDLKVPSTNPDVVGTTLDEGKYLVHLEKGYNKVTVCVWLEGQDVDCLNDISGSALHATIDFARYTAPAEQDVTD